MKKIVIGNWKMNPSTLKEAKSLANNIEHGIRGISKVDVVLAPPFPFLRDVGMVAKKSKLGAQNTFYDTDGAYTGEVSVAQLKSIGVKYVIIGHSERRALGETNEMIHDKLQLTLKAGLHAVLCVGERERNHGEAFPPIIREEIHAGLHGIKKSLLKNMIVAYEPIWAIGTGKPATPKNIFEISILIRRELFRMLGRKIALDVPILYGGSVNDKNATEFISEGRMDGLLVGGASLNHRVFSKIIDSIARL